MICTSVLLVAIEIALLCFKTNSRSAFQLRLIRYFHDLQNLHIWFHWLVSRPRVRDCAQCHSSRRDAELLVFALISRDKIAIKSGLILVLCTSSLFSIGFGMAYGHMTFWQILGIPFIVAFYGIFVLIYSIEGKAKN